MAPDEFIQSIRVLHARCCITNSPKDQGCGLNLHGIDRTSFVMLNGSKYQEYHGHRRKLCDRIIVGKWNDQEFVCAVELKGGKSIDVGDVLEQIQNGLNVAANILSGGIPRNWYPILLYNGHLGTAGITKLRRRPLSVQRQRRESYQVIKRDCNSSLVGILEDNAVQQ